MSDRVTPRLEALCDHILAARGPRLTSSHLCWIAFHSDFEAYRRLRRSITGTVWCKGRELPFPVGSDERWAARLMRSRQPWWARATGDVLALIILVQAALKGRAV